MLYGDCLPVCGFWGVLELLECQERLGERSQFSLLKYPLDYKHGPWRPGNKAMWCLMVYWAVWV